MGELLRIRVLWDFVDINKNDIICIFIICFVLEVFFFIVY